MRYSDLMSMDVFHKEIEESPKRLRDLLAHCLNIRTATMKGDDPKAMYQDLVETLRINESAISSDELTDEELVFLHAVRSAKRGTFSAGVINGLIGDPYWPYEAKEEELKSPVVRFLETCRHEVYDEVVLGANRCDLVSLQESRSLFKKQCKVIAVELKASLSELQRGWGQVAEFRRYSSATYFAMTPGLLLEASCIKSRSGDVYDLTGFNEKVERADIGLLIVRLYEGNDFKEPVFLSRPKEFQYEPDPELLEGVIARLKSGECRKVRS